MGFWLVFLTNWIINIIAIELLQLKKLRGVFKADPSLHKEYSPFSRTDLTWFNRPWLYLTCHLGVISIILWGLSLLITAFTCRLVILGHPEDKPLTGLRYYLFRLTIYISAKQVLWDACKQVWIYDKRP